MTKAYTMNMNNNNNGNNIHSLLYNMIIIMYQVIFFITFKKSPEKTKTEWKIWNKGNKSANFIITRMNSYLSCGRILWMTRMANSSKMLIFVVASVVRLLLYLIIKYEANVPSHSSYSSIDMLLQA